MEGQIDIYEAFPGLALPPPMWDCMKTCDRANIYTDTFPLGGKRCEYGYHMCGSSGKDMYSRTDEHNHVTFYCKYYKMKG